MLQGYCQIKRFQNTVLNGSKNSEHTDSSGPESTKLIICNGPVINCFTFRQLSD